METFIDKAFDNYLNPDYKVTDDNTNPLREMSESTLDEESKLNRLLGIVDKTLSEVKQRYDSIPIEQIRKEVTDTGRMPMIQKTLEQELAKMRTGGDVGDFGNGGNFGTGGAGGNSGNSGNSGYGGNGGLLDISDLLGKDLEIETQIIDTMIDLLIIEHYYSDPEIYPKTYLGGKQPVIPGKKPGIYEPENPPLEPGEDYSDEKDPKDPTGNGPGKDPTTGKKPTPPSDDIYPGDIEHDGKEPHTVEDSEFCDICKENVVNRSASNIDTKIYANTTGIPTNPADTEGDESAETDGGEIITETDDNGDPTEPRRAKEMADCAKMDLQLLNIILAVCKIIKALMIIIDPIYAIVTQTIEIAALVCGCWRNPANIGEIVQRLLQMAISIVTNIVSTLIDKFWKMLGLQCLSEQGMDLIQQIQDALRGVRKINTAIEETANAYARTVGDSYKDSAKILKSINDAKEEFLKNRENDFSVVSDMFKNFSGNDLSALWTGDKVNKNNILSIIGNNLSGSRVNEDFRKYYSTVTGIIDSIKSKPASQRFSEEADRMEKSLARVLKSTHIGFDYDEEKGAWEEFNAKGEGTGAEAWETQIDRLSEDTDSDKYGAGFGSAMLNAFGIQSYKNQGLVSFDDKNAETAKTVPENE